MDKSAKELIRQMVEEPKEAGLKNKVMGALAAGSLAAGAPGAFKANLQQTRDHGTTSIRAEKGSVAEKVKQKFKAPSVGESKKEGSMRSIIDDIIKGAEQNSFGRPISVQTNTEWTHLDTAKTAGALQLLAEQSYSVKEAAEFLDVSEEVVRAVLAAVG